MKNPDLVLFNAHVLTMDPTNPRAQQIKVADGLIVEVGSDGGSQCSKDTHLRLIDCGGKTVIPGFHDAHMHLFAMASDFLEVDCSPNTVSSIVDIQRRIAEQAVQVPAGTWIRASGYHEFHLEEKRHPTRWDLDKAAPAHPVKLTHRTRHACVLNSQGLALAGLGANTPDPPGGRIEREPGTGEPTGLLFGMNSYLSQNFIPPHPEEEFDLAMEQVNKMLLSQGVTSVVEATHSNGPAQWRYLERAKRTGILSPRVSMMCGPEVIDSLRRKQADEEVYAEKDTLSMECGTVKIVVDEIAGRLNPPPHLLNAIVLSAHEEGFQVAIHAVEASTVEAAITALEYALSKSPKKDHRHRIEHCSECPDHLIERIERAGIAVVTQPGFLYFNGSRYLADVEKEKHSWLYRIGSWWKRGIPVAASSDAPVAPPNPLVGIYAAVTRRSVDGQLLLAEESLLPEESIRMYTTGGAYVSFQESILGSVSPGKLADLVVLSNDPTRVPVEKIKDITVEMTIIGGEVVWERCNGLS